LINLKNESMKKNLWLHVKGHQVVDCLNAMGHKLEELDRSELPGFVWVIHSWSFQVTIEPPDTSAVLRQALGPVTYINMTVLLLQEQEALTMSPQELTELKRKVPHLHLVGQELDPASITDGMKQQYMYAGSFSCKHDTEGQEILTDGSGPYKICKLCESRVRQQEPVGP
jgi:hypothetical protein